MKHSHELVGFALVRGHSTEELIECMNVGLHPGDMVVVVVVVLPKYQGLSQMLNIQGR